EGEALEQAEESLAATYGMMQASQSSTLARTYYSEHKVLGAFVASSVERVWVLSMLAISLLKPNTTCGAGSFAPSCATR
ncbi:MAG TPA: hypothetical protein VKP69_18165, partial [Isosphaeraceae bacterium]|nr:hypothetical protein [Isosphaeraceae bacterium]